MISKQKFFLFLLLLGFNKPVKGSLSFANEQEVSLKNLFSKKRPIIVKKKDSIAYNLKITCEETDQDAQKRRNMLKDFLEAVFIYYNREKTEVKNLFSEKVIQLIKDEAIKDNLSVEAREKRLSEWKTENIIAPTEEKTKKLVGRYFRLLSRLFHPDRASVDLSHKDVIFEELFTFFSNLKEVNDSGAGDRNLCQIPWRLKDRFSSLFFQALENSSSYEDFKLLHDLIFIITSQTSPTYPSLMLLEEWDPRETLSLVELSLHQENLTCKREYEALITKLENISGINDFLDENFPEKDYKNRLNLLKAIEIFDKAISLKQENFDDWAQKFNQYKKLFFEDASTLSLDNLKKLPTIINFALLSKNQKLTYELLNATKEGIFNQLEKKILEWSIYKEEYQKNGGYQDFNDYYKTFENISEILHNNIDPNKEEAKKKELIDKLPDFIYLLMRSENKKFFDPKKLLDAVLFCYENNFDLSMCLKKNTLNIPFFEFVKKIKQYAVYFPTLLHGNKNDFLDLVALIKLFDNKYWLCDNSIVDYKYWFFGNSITELKNFLIDPKWANHRKEILKIYIHNQNRNLRENIILWNDFLNQITQTNERYQKIFHSSESFLTIAIEETKAKTYLHKDEKEVFLQFLETTTKEIASMVQPDGISDEDKITFKFNQKRLLELFINLFYIPSTMYMDQQIIGLIRSQTNSKDLADRLNFIKKQILNIDFKNFANLEELIKRWSQTMLCAGLLNLPSENIDKAIKNPFSNEYYHAGMNQAYEETEFQKYLSQYCIFITTFYPIINRSDIITEYNKIRM